MKEIPIGLIFSTQGTYQHIGNNAYQGARYAISEINKSGFLPYPLKGIHKDPQGILDNYAQAAQELLTQGVKHIFGTITSSSRKEVLPDIQDKGALLWYSSPYEGYECDEQVVYHGACPNQNLYPLLGYVMPRLGKRTCLVASNYIWGWESNRIASELIGLAQGEVLFERFYHLTHLDFSVSIKSILEAKPDFIVNNLVGESSYAFLEQLNQQWEGEPLAVLSCNLTECELVQLPQMPRLKLITAAPFFETVNLPFTKTVQQQLGDEPISSMFMGAYLSVLSFAHAYKKAGGGETNAIRSVLGEMNYTSPLKSNICLADNQHAHLPCYIAQWQHNQFEILCHFPEIKPNPFLAAESVLDIEMSGTIAPSTSTLRLIS